MRGTVLHTGFLTAPDTRVHGFRGAPDTHVRRLPGRTGHTRTPASGARQTHGLIGPEPCGAQTVHSASKQPGEAALCIALHWLLYLAGIIQLFQILITVLSDYTHPEIILILEV